MMDFNCLRSSFDTHSKEECQDGYKNNDGKGFQVNF